MALAPTLYDLDVELHHLDRKLDLRFALRTARHPSEALDRLWLRVLALCWLHRERIAFGPGLSDPDAPDLFADDLTGQKTLWARVGRQDPAKFQREADRAGQAEVALLLESPRRLEAFVAAARVAGCTRLGRVELAAVDPALLAALASVDERRSRLTVTLVGDHFYVQRGAQAVDGPLIRPASPARGA